MANIVTKNREKKKEFVRDGHKKVATVKSYQESSTSFVSCNYSETRRDSWFYNATEVSNEITTTSDNIQYNFGTASGSKQIINQKYVTDRKRYASKMAVVKKNDVVITSGFSIDYENKQINFDVSNDPLDIIKISYAYENGSMFELVSEPGKLLRLDYVETQFTQGCSFNDSLRFELILNNDSTGNTDVVLGYEEYQTAQDFLSKGNHGTELKAFGELTKAINIFPWNYLSGYTIKPVGDNTTDPTKNEFNKIKMYLVNDQGYGDINNPCEIATGTFYCFVESL